MVGTYPPRLGVLIELLQLPLGGGVFHGAGIASGILTASAYGSAISLTGTTSSLLVGV